MAQQYTLIFHLRKLKLFRHNIFLHKKLKVSRLRIFSEGKCQSQEIGFGSIEVSFLEKTGVDKVDVRIGKALFLNAGHIENIDFGDHVFQFGVE
jgi:hypothetical protein